MEWREVSGYPDYIVSSEGQVGSRKHGKFKILKHGFNAKGYRQVALCNERGPKSIRIHVLVARAFLPPKPTLKHEINHMDGDIENNRDTNLEWMTSSQNKQHSYNVLGRKAPRGEESGRAKVTEEKVREIRRRCAAGETMTAVAASCGIGRTQVGRIVRNESWSWLEVP